MRRLVLVLASFALLLVGCGGDTSAQRAPVSADDGIHASGRVGAGRVNVDDGEPESILGDCDPADGPDGDFCIVTRTIGGSSVTLVVENPGIMLRLGSFGVRGDRCQGFTCEAEDGFLVVDVRVDGESRRASSGSVEVTRAGTRYAGSFNLRFSDGSTLTGTFDVAPVKG